MSSVQSRSSARAFLSSPPDRRAGRGVSRGAALLAAALALLASPHGAGAVEATTGLVSLAAGQVAQLNVAGFNDPNELPDPEAAACQVRLTLRAGRCAEREACEIGDPNIFEISNPNILPGEAVFLRVSAAQLNLGGRGARALVRGTLEAECRDPAAAAALKATLEIYDAATGRTAVVLGAD